ncbi:sugar ABC transporter substrate-binding protein [Vallitalea longa]|uniref:Sugar ABC transporter substrate-binding protein n=1 Tax=Vallitalea longa TaxID=2936439 RepID=A0A9W6DHH1_9FIRM|nr:extracellular solute-binding protein [Vallitalea longa]GKX31458.1 sugar ABC transporter substrate-binding protein [Vallitalea longa]
MGIIFKKSIIVVLTGILMVSMVGCGKTDTVNGSSDDTKSTKVTNEVDENINLTGYPIAKEPITLTMTGRQGATKDWQNTIQLEQIKEQFGLDIQAEPYSNDSWKTQFTLMLSTNELTDIVVNSATSLAIINQYGAQGYFLPLNEYLEYMPNLKARFEEYPEWKAALTAPDGNIYSIAPFNMDPTREIPRIFLNQVWLDNVGMEEPTNLNELYEVLKAFKEKDANGNGDSDDEIPMAYDRNFYWYTDIPLLSAFGLQGYTRDYLLIEDNGTIASGNVTDNYKKFLKYMRKLYSEGLIDQEAYIQTRQEVESKANEDRVGLVGCPSAPYVVAKKDQTWDKNWTAIGGLTEKAGQQGVIPLKNKVTDSGVFIVNAETKHPIEIARLIDYLCTDEGILTGTHGFKGHSYELIEMEGVKVADLPLPEGYKSQGEYRQQRAVIQGAFMMMTGTVGYPEEAVLNMTDERLEKVIANPDSLNIELEYWRLLIERLRRKENLEYKQVVPNLVYKEKEEKRVATLKTDIMTYIDTAVAQFVTGEVDIDEGWDAYVTTLKQMGLDELIEIEQTAYDRMFK